MPRTPAANQPPHHRARAYQRVVRLGWLEWIGIPALALLPLLALAGWLGPASQRLEATVPHGAGALKLEVSYPSRTRHKDWMRASRPSWSVQQAGRGNAVAWRRRPPSRSAPLS